MPKTIKVKINNIEHDAVEVSFEIERESWNEYTLLDGGRIRTKTTVQRIFKVLDEKGQQLKDPTGEAVFIVNHNTQAIPSE